MLLFLFGVAFGAVLGWGSLSCHLDLARKPDTRALDVVRRRLRKRWQMFLVETRTGPIVINARRADAIGDAWVFQAASGCVLKRLRIVDIHSIGPVPSIKYPHLHDERD